jgi:starvation-inducible DNA-binding protein
MDTTTAPAPAHLPPLGAHARDRVGADLQATLVEMIDLALVGKQLHWSVVDPRFLSLHRQLDELVASWHDLADTVAERAVAIGVWPNGQAGVVAGEAPRAPVARGPIDGDTVLRELALRLAATAERARERLDTLGELDAVSQDVLVGIVRELEQHLWMLRAQMNG